MEILAVTNRKLCQTDFIEQIGKLAESGVAGIILREKDLSEEAYEALAEDCLQKLRPSQVPLIINQRDRVAKRLSVPAVQLSFSDFLKKRDTLQGFQKVLVSIHSAEEAKEAETYGADGVIAGHIFATDCKKGVPPRGLTFLEEILETVRIPVYAIGGITSETLPMLKHCPIQGVCVMSASMRENFFWNTIDNQGSKD